MLKTLIDLWGKEGALPGFNEFVHKHIIPVCILIPTKDTFDWTDAQTVLVSDLHPCSMSILRLPTRHLADFCFSLLFLQLLRDIAACLQAIYSIEAFSIGWLRDQYLPSLHLDPSHSQQFCNTLMGDKKKFHDYLKVSVVVCISTPSLGPNLGTVTHSSRSIFSAFLSSTTKILLDAQKTTHHSTH